MKWVIWASPAHAFSEVLYDSEVDPEHWANKPHILPWTDVISPWDLYKDITVVCIFTCALNKYDTLDWMFLYFENLSLYVCSTGTGISHQLLSMYSDIRWSPNPVLSGCCNTMICDLKGCSGFMPLDLDWKWFMLMLLLITHLLSVKWLALFGVALLIHIASLFVYLVCCWTLLYVFID